MKHLLALSSMSFLLLLSLSACQQASEANKTDTSTTQGNKNNLRDHNDAVFISHEGIAKAVTKQIWKEIVLGEYNVEDLKMFDLGKQTSKLGAQDPYQIITYGYQIQRDPEIFRISLRSDLKGEFLHYQLNEKQYYSCKEKDYDPNNFSIEMKTAVSKLMAEDYLKRKILELNR